MSYSFSILAATKDEAKVKVAEALDRVVATQPIHAKDRAAAVAHASAMIDLLEDSRMHHVGVSVNGHVSWRDVLKEDGSNPLCAVSISANAEIVSP